MANSNLTNAKKAKNDEFYTQYNDIEKEVNAYLEYNPDVFKNKTILLPCDDPEWSNFTKFFSQNFEKLQIKKLISTSFASDSKTFKSDYTPTLFEIESDMYDKSKTNTKGKIFILDRDRNADKKINVQDIHFDRYLELDGDFRSEEIKKLRDEADIIITNPPFSLFREFLNWIVAADKKFLVVGNKNCIAYKEVFNLFKNNKMWSGRTEWSGGMWFETKDLEDVDKVIDNINMKNVASFWLTNIDHGRRHQPLPLMTLEDNLKYSKHKEIKGKVSYDKYDNYDAIEIPFTDSIPSDYDGVMGVPITFLDKYNPDQFEILECHEPCIDLEILKQNPVFKERKSRQITSNGKLCQKTYHRVFIKHKR